MNIIQQAELLKNVPDHALQKELLRPTGSMPSYLVLSELKRRKDVRDNFGAMQRLPETSIAEEFARGIGSADVGKYPDAIRGAMPGASGTPAMASAGSSPMGGGYAGGGLVTLNSPAVTPKPAMAPTTPLVGMLEPKKPPTVEDRLGALEGQVEGLMAPKPILAVAPGAIDYGGGVGSAAGEGAGDAGSASADSTGGVGDASGDGSGTYSAGGIVAALSPEVAIIRGIAEKQTPGEILMRMSPVDAFLHEIGEEEYSPARYLNRGLGLGENFGFAEGGSVWWPTTEEFKKRMKRALTAPQSSYDYSLPEVKVPPLDPELDRQIKRTERGTPSPLRHIEGGFTPDPGLSLGETWRNAISPLPPRQPDPRALGPALATIGGSEVEPREAPDEETVGRPAPVIDYAEVRNGSIEGRNGMGPVAGGPVGGRDVGGPAGGGDAGLAGAVSPGDLQEHMAQIRGIAMPDRFAAMEARNLADAEKLKGDRRTAQGLALLTSGMAMLGGESPFANVNIGRGALAGIKEWNDAERQIKASEIALRNAENQITVAKANRDERQLEMGVNSWLKAKDNQQRALDRAEAMRDRRLRTDIYAGDVQQRSEDRKESIRLREAQSVIAEIRAQEAVIKDANALIANVAVPDDQKAIAMRQRNEAFAALQSAAKRLRMLQSERDTKVGREPNDKPPGNVYGVYNPETGKIDRVQ